MTRARTPAETVRTIVAAHFRGRVAASAITDDASFEKLLGADGLDRIEIVTAIEEALAITIPDEAFGRFATMRELVELAEQLVAERPAIRSA